MLTVLLVVALVKLIWSSMLKPAAAAPFKKFCVVLLSQVFEFNPPFQVSMLLVPMYPVMVRCSNHESPAGTP